MNELLRVQDLSVTYGGRGRRAAKHALSEVSVGLSEGETLGVVGESGSGKSTLGNCVLGLVRPTAGRIEFGGRDITHLSVKARRGLSSEIQAVFQDPYSTFNPHRTIEQSISETLPRRSQVPPAERRSELVAMLERVGLDETALRKYPAQFSGGQRQRLSIARALLPSPRLVVCDESVSALDLSVQAQVLNLLLELQRERNVAYLFITHDLAVVRHMSTQIAVLEHGVLVEAGAADEVTQRPREDYTRRLLDASPEANPRLQDARRRSRRALRACHALGSEASQDHLDELVFAMEMQAVIEAAESTSSSALTAGAVLVQEGGHAVTDDLEAKRTRLLGLARRTSSQTVGAKTDALLAGVRNAQAASMSVDVSRMLASGYADVLGAIASGAESRAIADLSALHREILSSAHLRPHDSPGAPSAVNFTYREEAMN